MPDGVQIAARAAVAELIEAASECADLLTGCPDDDVAEDAAERLRAALARVRGGAE